MRAVSFLMTGLAAGASFGAVACGNGDDTASPPAAVAAPDASKGLDATGGGLEDSKTGLDATTPDAGEGEAAAPTLALLRLANWSADSPSVDFCMAPHGTGAFRGPILGEAAAAIDDAGGDAGSGVLSFPSASAYLSTDPGQYDARLVAGGSVDCSAGLTQDATLPALPSGGLETVALLGAAHPQHGEPGLELVPFVDELTTNAFPGALIIRVINAAVDLPDVQVGTFTTYFTSFFPSGVKFGASSKDSTADTNGYIAQLPITNEGIVASTTVASLLGTPPDTTVAQTPDISLPSGNSVTFVVVGATGASGPNDAGVAFAQILECVDNAGTLGLQGTCNVVSH